MKKTTKLFAVIAVAVSTLFSASTFAQTSNMSPNSEIGWRFGIGINAGLFPSHSALDYGLGADVRLQLDLAKALSLTATAGYTRLMRTSNLLPDIDFIPLKGGVKIFPIRGMYISGEAGAGFGIKNGSKTNFIYSGGLGLALANHLDISARYEGYVNDSSSSTYFKKTGQYALRLAYGFKL